MRATLLAGLDPVWNEDIEFHGVLGDLIASNKGAGLRMRVYDKDFLHADDHLGEVEVSLSSFAVAPSRTVKKEAPLNPQGTLFFSLTWTPDREKVEIAPAAYGPAQWMATNAQGVLKIQLERGFKLPSADSNGLSDPYAIITCGGEKKTSKTCWKTLDPEWKEGWELDGTLGKFLGKEGKDGKFPTDGKDGGLHLKIMDKDRVRVPRPSPQPSSSHPDDLARSLALAL